MISSGCIARHFNQSRYHYVIKHHGALTAMAGERSEFVLLVLRTVVDLFRGKGMQRIRPRLQAPLRSKPNASGSNAPFGSLGDPRDSGRT